MTKHVLRRKPKYADFFGHHPDGNMRFAAVVFLVLAVPFLLWLMRAF